MPDTKPKMEIVDDVRSQVINGVTILLIICVYLGLVLFVRFPLVVRGLVLTLLLGAVAAITRLSRHSRPNLTRHVLVWGLTSWLLLAMWWFDIAWLPFAALALVLADAILVRGSEIVTGGTVALAVTWLAQQGARNYPVSGYVILTLLFLMLVELVFWSLYEALGWSWGYYNYAQVLVAEARDRQGELNQTLSRLADRNLQLDQLNRLAQSLRQAAEDARRAKEQFVANVSHELRTPLNMVLGFAETIMESPEVYRGRIPPMLMADLAVIQRNAAHLSALVSDVLDLSQMEAGRMGLSREHVSLKELLEEACVIVRPLFEHRGLYLRAEMPDDPLQVYCDRTRIRQVLLNLLSNAGRFTEEGGVAVEVSLTADNVLVSVSDTGPGIAPDQQGKLFQPFEQLDGSISRRHSGTGLGLNISRRLVEMHGGRMWVESKEGTGTTFFFRLPVGPTPLVDEKPFRWLSAEWSYREPVPSTKTSPREGRPRILVLDADGVLRRLLRRSSDEVSIVSVAAVSDVVEELSHAPARALLINESSLGSTVRGLIPPTPLPDSMPVIVCSVPGVGDSYADLGASGYLVKPVALNDLRDALNRLQLGDQTILIVDDEPDCLQLFGRMISSLGRGYRTLMARDGQEAIKIIEGNRPGAILLDLIMPNMDGFEFLKVKNLRAEWRDIPTLLISARDPAGYPIVSNGLAVSRGTGLSVQQLLRCIDAVV